MKADVVVARKALCRGGVQKLQLSPGPLQDLAGGHRPIKSGLAQPGGRGAQLRMVENTPVIPPPEADHEFTMKGANSLIRSSVLRWPARRVCAGLHYVPSGRLPASRRAISGTPRRLEKKQAADDPNFTSILDNPPELIRTGRRHGPGLIILGASYSLLFRRIPG